MISFPLDGSEFVCVEGGVPRIRLRHGSRSSKGRKRGRSVVEEEGGKEGEVRSSSRKTV